MANFSDFDLGIEVQQDGQIAVTALNSSVGKATVTTANPFTDEEITRLLGMLDDSANASPAEETRSARAFGEKLYKLVFKGDVATAYAQAVQQAGERGLRVTLNLSKAGALVHWPWELLREPAGDYLAFSRQTSVARRGVAITPRPPLEISLPLRVLVMIAVPSDQPSFNADSEWQALNDATYDLRERGLLALERVEGGQIGALQRKVRDGGKAYHIFHFVGHPADDDSAEGLIALEDPRKRTTAPVSAEDLIRELADNNSVRVAVFSSPLTRRQDVRDPFWAVATRMIAKGMPAVIEMQYGLGEVALRTFASEFYRLLAEGYPIEVATSNMRQVLQRTAGGLDWVSPALHLGTTTGWLFPKRPSYEGRISTGGLRTRLPMLAAAAVIGLFGILLTVLSVVLRPPEPPREVIDLAIKGMNVFPPNPAPGDPVSVTLQIENKSEGDSGPFKWTWYTQDPSSPDSVPTLTGEVPNLTGGTTIVVKGTFPFGGWGTFSATAFVNEDITANEKNFLNNVSVKNVSTDETKPFDIDFRVLPSGDEVIESVELKGDEFDSWKMKIVPLVGLEDTECKDAIAKISVDDLEQQWRLVTGLAGRNDVCKSLPMRIVLGSPVGELPPLSAVIEFAPTVAGVYSVTLLTADGKNVLAEKTRTISEADATARKLQQIDINPGSGSMTDVIIEYTPPVEALTVIHKVSLLPTD
jgi:hypothetical protein